MKVLILIVLLSTTVPIPMIGCQTDVNVGEKVEMLEVHTPAYTEHDRILIATDADFIARASLEGWPGNGSESNPYRIEGYNITYRGYCIRIDDVNLHFRIANCYLASNSTGVLTDGSDAGIFLVNVNHASISGNTIVGQEDHAVYACWSEVAVWGNSMINNHNGVVFETSSGHLWSNDILNSTDWGIYVEDSNDCVIRQTRVSSVSRTWLGLYESSDCSVYSNDFGNCSVVISDSDNCDISGRFYNGSSLVIKDCTQITVSGLRAVSPSDYGILVRRSNQISISQNTIESAGIAGIGGIDSSSCNYTENIISDCHNGILLNNETSSLLTHNYIFDYTEYGVRIDSGSDNWIYTNLLSSGGSGFFFDDGSENHWDDGLFLGNFMVGITEGVFEIDGSAGSLDNFARSIDPVPVPGNEPVICSDPILVKFNENEGILAWVIWLRGATANYGYGIEDVSVHRNGSLVYWKLWTGPCTIIVDISDNPPGVYEYSLGMWIGYFDYTAGSLDLSSVSFYFPGFYSTHDEDADGMFDEWEVAFGLDPSLDDSHFDPDSDDLVNIDEFFAGTDPLNPDSDFDSFPDGWEVANGFDPLNATAPLFEYILFYSPFIASAYVTLMGVAGIALFLDRKRKKL